MDSSLNPSPAGNGNDELSLAPIDQETESYRQMIMERHSPIPPVDFEPEAPRYQFSILHIIIGTTLVAAVTGLCQLISPNIIAGAFGLVTLVSLMFVIQYGKTRPRLQMAWAFLVLLYIAFAIVAAYRA